MKRQIKFRAKRKDNGEWVTGDLLTNHPHYGTAILEHGCINYAVDPDTVGQFTGLYDVDSKPIYEGDILEYQYQEEKYQLVKYENCDDAQGFSVLTDFEPCIVGNIFDNPELLKSCN